MTQFGFSAYLSLEAWDEVGEGSHYDAVFSTNPTDILLDFRNPHLRWISLCTSQRTTSKASLRSIACGCC